MKVVISKNNSNFRKEYSFNPEDFINHNSKIYEGLEVKNLDYFNEFASDLNTFLDVFKLSEDKDDLIICEFNMILKFLSFFPNDVAEDFLYKRSFKESLPVLDKLGFTDLMLNVFENDKPLSLNFYCYFSPDLIMVLRQTFLRVGDYILCLNKDTSNLNYIQKEDKNLFYTSNHGVIIIQEGKIVFANQAYADLMHVNLDEIIGMPFSYDYEKFEPINEDMGDDLELLFNKLLNCEIYAVEGYLKRKLNGKTYWDRLYAFPTLYHGKNAIQKSIYDVTIEKTSEEKFLRFQDSLNSILDLSGYAYGTYDEKNKLQWSPQIFDIVEADPSDFDGSNHFLRNYMMEDDLDKIYSLLKNENENTAKVSLPIKIITKKNNLKYLSFFIIANYRKSKIINYAIFIQDITAITEDEQRLFETNRKLKHYLDERELLLKEVHYRVKSNLQIILSLLTLDSRFNTDPATTLESTKNRINSMAIIHEMVYQSSDLAHVNMKDYITTEVQSLFSMNHVQNINLVYDLLDIEVNMDVAIPLGIIINELVNNAIKYGFSDKEEGDLYINLISDDNMGMLIIGDNGVDFPEDVDIYNSGSLGLTVVNILTAQIDGEFNKLNRSGAFFEVKFPLNG
jgi:two-component sensor histidine kinase